MSSTSCGVQRASGASSMSVMIGKLFSVPTATRGPAVALEHSQSEVCPASLRARTHQVTLFPAPGEKDLVPEASTCGACSLREVSPW